jgi:peptidase MA superfamily protein
MKVLARVLVTFTILTAILLSTNGWVGSAASQKVMPPEHGIPPGFSHMFTPHFVVGFPESVDRRQVTRLADRLELVYEAVGKKFSYFPGHPFTVVLYSQAQFHEATVTPGWTQGIFDGTIRLPIKEIAGKQDHAPSAPDSSLIHEYVHAVAHRLSGGHVPAWLSEGLALYFDGGVKPWNHTKVGRTEDYRPLRQLHGDLLDLSTHDARLAYRESYEATRVLIDRYGLGRVERLLRRLSVTSDFARAFEAELPDRYVDFEQNWLAEQELKGY